MDEIQRKRSTRPSPLLPQPRPHKRPRIHPHPRRRHPPRHRRDRNPTSKRHRIPQIMLKLPIHIHTKPKIVPIRIRVPTRCRTAGLAKAHVWNSSEAVTAEDIRHAHENGRNKPVDVWNAGWACSWCYSTFKETLEKAEAHPLASAVVGTKENIVRAVKWGVDVFGRSDVRYIHVQDNMDLPDWVLAKRDRFSFLLNRRNEFAGFVDLREESKAEAAAAAAAKVVKPK
ncbi:hypothetical protein BCR33DRAFT_461601 [Rhizoclosmatium globosum]|uniref:Uncharacterized protein n=1 Tax=Rhizoclosmatium globosum TaxID=329046 RepID=A0A1Y2CZA1_9FUNG|nr:hypothetical protein BCR33DRAFT_461601 [Rhizoclosmatium globosum]|eukprot:ORY51675.1 hypothetical protein BCR33DRAFT_461601 [Rhizoclosmatium globosum]